MLSLLCSDQKWSTAKRRLITVTGMSITRHMILTDFRQRTDSSPSICFVKRIGKVAAGLGGWIYTPRLSWLKRSLLPKEDIPLRVASSWPPPCRKPQHCLHPGLIQLSSSTSQASPPRRAPLPAPKSRLCCFRGLKAGSESGSSCLRHSQTVPAARVITCNLTLVRNAQLVWLPYHRHTKAPALPWTEPPSPFPRILSQPLSFSSSVFGIGKKKTSWWSRRREEGVSGQNYIAFIQGHLLFQASKYYFCITTVYHPSHKEEFMAIVIAISSAQIEVSSIFLFVIEEIFLDLLLKQQGRESLILLFFKYTHINIIMCF